MKCFIFTVLVFAVLAKCFSADPAEKCENDVCKISNNCRCSSEVNPSADLSSAPQLIVLAFVEALTSELYQNRWSILLESRKNPDGSYIGATFYVPHEYTDYQRVLDLAGIGFEVGVHSISNDPHQAYWKNANESLLRAEFAGQKKIISKFANIPEDQITGVMTPQLVLAGDISIDAFVAEGFTYDSSWASKVALFPYTFDYKSTQECYTGNKCPAKSNPGFWESPIINLQADDGVCATVAACFRNKTDQTVDEIAEWVVAQVQAQRSTNRAPVTFIIESTWFDNVENSWDGLNEGLDRLSKLDDVFFVTQHRVLEWMKNPVSVADFTTDLVEVSADCTPYSCTLKKPDGTTRYMNSCIPCPDTYPWINNPEGN